ncbi:MAG: ABC transporter ATP-binding protein/permease [Sphaerochaeta sp.]|jgi:ATP-binding cassette subfamily B multidrug efflux pump|nr:ABC transporter ATP-binding protein/permease [Sphaerochaeta sp.]MCH3920004.1 ABC transporter ATP-binding protein/permease [Sphaerochaeta sp.]MCI2045974.1 ABC transporter ATP-binding protein/permease [Sphaerochaeta sp.]MCI2077075.1 ABC transporter ATP-binding protein/permease [Sphaerochaeta sp.]MCI2097034.1 ABC transporter ATP-binding protein/permease [Sphaerochaeta sp.]
MPRPMKFGPKAKDPKKTGKRLFRLVFGTHKVTFVLVLLTIVVSSLAMVEATLFLKTLVDGYIVPMVQGSSRDFSGLAKAMIQIGVILAFGAAASYLTQRLMVYVANDTLRDIRRDMFAHMESLPISYFDTHSHGEIMSRFTNDTDTLQQMISQSIVQVMSSLLTVVMVFVAMIRLSWMLTVVVLLFIGLMLLSTQKIGKKSGANFKVQQTNLAAVNGYVEEMVGGVKVVKVFNHEQLSKQQFDQLNENLRQSSTKANAYGNVMGPIMNNIGNLQYVVVTLVGAMMTISGVGGLTVGSLASFLQMTRTFSNPIGQMAQQMNSILMALAGAERVFQLLDEPSESDDGYVRLVNVTYDADGTIRESATPTGKWAWKHPHKDGSPTTYRPLAGEIEMEDVDFGYTPEKIVLHHISLTAKPGQKIAFVGATGAGKTTITNLLNRFYDIQQGKIRFDGINITKIRKDDLRRSLGMVLQDTHLFTGTIRDNIRFGKPDATDEEIRAAAKLANADSFIMMHPNGYETMLTGDGEELSQGQRQLLSIARAAVADPPVMILDEATSSIDTHTETLVQQGMDRLMEGRTVFVIAHRLSTVQNSQLILVLDHGTIIERGTHDELIAKKGVYYQLYTGATELS